MPQGGKTTGHLERICAKSSVTSSTSPIALVPHCHSNIDNIFFPSVCDRKHTGGLACTDTGAAGGQDRGGYSEQIKLHTLRSATCTCPGTSPVCTQPKDWSRHCELPDTPRPAATNIWPMMIKAGTGLMMWLPAFYLKGSFYDLFSIKEKIKHLLSKRSLTSGEQLPPWKHQQDHGKWK